MGSEKYHQTVWNGMDSLISAWISTDGQEMPRRGSGPRQGDDEHYLQALGSCHEDNAFSLSVP